MLGALSGVLAGFTALAVAELVAAVVRPQSGPVIAVGEASIDATPAAVKDWAIRHFGTNDKFVLQLGILVVLAVLALVLGALARDSGGSEPPASFSSGSSGRRLLSAGPTPRDSPMRCPLSWVPSPEPCFCTSWWAG